jgi:hypothetical protein
VLALDYFHGTPELVPLVQSDGELNHTTSHNILKLILNPRAASHEIVQLKGEESPVQMHVDTPVIYLRWATTRESRTAERRSRWTRMGRAGARRRTRAAARRQQRLRDGARGCAHRCAGAGELQHRGCWAAA